MNADQPTDQVIIIGGGQAGVEAAAALRAKQYGGSVVLVAAEPEVPYQRPPLSKAFLSPKSTDADLDEVVLRSESWFERNQVEVHRGCAVVEIDRHRALVHLDDGRQLPYTDLVLATGARNRALPVPGAELAGVHGLRSLEEARALVTALRRSRSVAVIGAGFIGLEAAAAAAKHGAAVTVLEAAARPMARAVSEPISTFFEDVHRSHGIDLRCNTGARRIVERNGRAAGVELSDGTVIDADTVIVGVGVAPETGLAEKAGLEVANGIAVDARLRTEDPRIFAIGDCASFPAAGGSRRRLESVQNAVDHARHVAAQIVGEEGDYAAVPWFWTEQFDCKLQMAGLIDGHSRTIIRGVPEELDFSVFCFGANDQLLGVESVNRARDHMAARRLLARGLALTPDQAADPTVDLKAMSRS